jgi:hypothetical protein
MLQLDAQRRMAWLGFDVLVTLVCAAVLVQAVT